MDCDFKLYTGKNRNKRLQPLHFLSLEGQVSFKKQCECTNPFIYRKDEKSEQTTIKKSLHFQCDKENSSNNDSSLQRRFVESNVVDEFILEQSALRITLYHPNDLIPHLLVYFVQHEMRLYSSSARQSPDCVTYRASLLDRLARDFISLPQFGNLQMQTLHQAIYLFDFALDVAVIPQSRLPCILIAALLVASKFTETNLPSPKMYLSLLQPDEPCSLKQLLHMEKYLLQLVDFRCAAPLPLEAAHALCILSGAQREAHYLSTFFLECMLSYAPSKAYRWPLIKLAAGVVLLTLMRLQPSLASHKSVWNSLCVHHSGYTAKNLYTVVRKVNSVCLKVVGKSKIVCWIREKYGDDRYMSVGLLYNAFTSSQFADIVFK